MRTEAEWQPIEFAKACSCPNPLVDEGTCVWCGHSIVVEVPPEPIRPSLVDAVRDAKRAIEAKRKREWRAKNKDHDNALQRERHKRRRERLRRLGLNAQGRTAGTG